MYIICMLNNCYPFWNPLEWKKLVKCVFLFTFVVALKGVILSNLGNIKTLSSVLQKYNIWLGEFEAFLAFRIEVGIFVNMSELEYIIINVVALYILSIWEKLIHFKITASCFFPLYFIWLLFLFNLYTRVRNRHNEMMTQMSRPPANSNNKELCSLRRCNYHLNMLVAA